MDALLKPTANKRTSAAKSQGSRSRSQMSGLQFPVGRIFKFLKKGKYADRVSASAPVYLAAIAEYITAEIVELAVAASTANKKIRIVPRSILLAIRNDPELNELLKNAQFARGGVIPHVEAAILPAKQRKKLAMGNPSVQEGF